MTTPATTPADWELLQRIAENDPSWVLKYLEQNTRFDVPRIRELFEFAKAQATAMLATPSPAQAAPAVTDEQIRDVFMANGFTIKEGQTDLKPYVYAAARALLALATPSPGKAQERIQELERACESMASTIENMDKAVRATLGIDPDADDSLPELVADWMEERASPGKADAEDAARWRTTVRYVAGRYSETGDQRFVLPGLFPVSMNIMQGSVAEHFTQAIDAAIDQERDKEARS